MADFLTFHLVSPEKKLASIDAKSVCIPGIEGDMTLLPNHAEFVTTLRPGFIHIEADSGIQEFVVTGGFVEISGSVATVLAEKAIVKSEVDKVMFQALIRDAEENSKNANDKRKSQVDLRLNDLKTLADTFN